MTVDEALNWSKDLTEEFLSVMDEACIKTLAAEVQRLQLIVSGKTQFDVMQHTAKLCWEWIEAQGTIEMQTGPDIYYVTPDDWDEFKSMFSLSD